MEDTQSVLRRPFESARIAPIRNGAVASAALVQPRALASAFWCIGTGPLRRALAGATRSGTAGVGHLLAIH